MNPHLPWTTTLYLPCPACDKEALIGVYAYEVDYDCGMYEDGWELDGVTQTCNCEVADSEWEELVEEELYERAASAAADRAEYLYGDDR
jgi:hypothetical protein